MSKHVLIVGAGIVGLSVAYYCARSGHRVSLIERDPPERDGCSFANAGMIVPSHFIPLASPGMVRLGLRSLWNAENPVYVKPRWSADLVDWSWKFSRAATRAHADASAPRLRDLHLASRDCYQQWAALWGEDFGLAERGLLVLCNTELGLEEEAEIAEQARALDMPARMLTAAATSALEPNVRMTIAGSVYYPLDCHLIPDRLMAALSRQAEHAGVRAHYRTNITGWQLHDNRVTAVQTSNGTFTADEFVLCAGIWSSDVARDLGLRLPMQAGKGYSLTVETAAPFPGACAILSEARVAMTPMGNAVRFGGTMELAGLDEGLNPARVRGIVKSVARYYPDFTSTRFAGARVRSGLRPCAPDGMPYVGRFARFANLSAATGHAMMGVSLGPITGKLIAELVSGQRPSCSMDGLSPDRYA
ncbi:MAG: NAD(P)/FAD-dependent oxidoreductase [Casimicrobiaceae bacterium]